MDESADRVRTLFSMIARKYDLLNRILSLAQDKRWRRLLIQKISHGGVPFKTLDLCAGTADLTLALLAAGKNGARVVALDFSREMLELARGKVNRADKNARVSFVEADALTLPFADNSFDATMSAFGLRNLSDLEKGLSEMARVTRAGGKIAILEFSLPNRFPVRHMALFSLKTFVPIVGSLFAHFNAYNYLSKTIQEFPPASAICRLMEKCGILGVETQQRMFGVVTLYIGRVK
jgi:demethylmenaquinone methyltransferase/2-methoxy-6-polyprenyl-1,4-benzoquinol methylase